MLAKDLLLNCLNCKNNIDCWGLNRNFESDGQDPREINISVESYSNNLKKFNVESLHDVHGIASMMFIRTMFLHPAGMNDTVKDILQTSMCVIEALTNSSYDQWECPEEYEYISKDA